MESEIKGGDLVRRRRGNRAERDITGLVKETYQDGRAIILWDKKASNGQQQSTIRTEFLIKVYPDEEIQLEKINNPFNPHNLKGLGPATIRYWENFPPGWVHWRDTPHESSDPKIQRLIKAGLMESEMRAPEGRERKPQMYYRKKGINELT